MMPAANKRFAGDNFLGIIENCYVTGVINGENNTGGIAGVNRGVIRNCYPRVALRLRGVIHVEILRIFKKFWYEV